MVFYLNVQRIGISSLRIGATLRMLPWILGGALTPIIVKIYAKKDKLKIFLKIFWKALIVASASAFLIIHLMELINSQGNHIIIGLLGFVYGFLLFYLTLSEQDLEGSKNLYKIFVIINPKNKIFKPIENKLDSEVLVWGKKTDNIAPDLKIYKKVSLFKFVYSILGMICGMICITLGSIIIFNNLSKDPINLKIKISVLNLELSYAPAGVVFAAIGFLIIFISKYAREKYSK